MQDPASSNPPISAGLILSPSYLVSAAQLPSDRSAAANNSELSSRAAAPNTGSYLRSPRLKCQPSQNAKNLYGARSKPTAIPAPPPLGIYRSSARVKLSNEAGKECAASADVRASPWEQSAMRRIAPCVLRDGRGACPRAAPTRTHLLALCGRFTQVIGKSPFAAAQSHRLRRFPQACRAHRRVSSPAVADGYRIHPRPLPPATSRLARRRPRHTVSLLV